MRHGLVVSETMDWGIKMDRNYSSCAAILNSPSQTLSLKHMSQRSGQLDFVITRRDLLNNVLNTRSYHSADCISVLECKPRGFSTPNGKLIRGRTVFFTPSDRYSQTTPCTVQKQNGTLTALTTYGKKEQKITDWYEANNLSWILSPKPSDMI